MNRDELLKNDLKRTLILWQLLKVNLEDIRTNDLIKEWAKIAKENKNKSFIDLRAVAADTIRSLDSFMLKTKQTMITETFNSVISTLNNEQIKEIDLLLDEITYLPEDIIESITNQVKIIKSDINGNRDS